MELPASLSNFDFCGYNERHRPAGSGLLFVIGVIPGKEISSAVVPDKHGIALRNCLNDSINWYQSSNLGALEQLMVTKANIPPSRMGKRPELEKEVVLRA
ncbi:hypothetical protein JHK87_050348 [Glycine soja]|nr:hypothetical protein JHK87_050348 [Glycine soja]